MTQTYIKTENTTSSLQTVFFVSNVTAAGWIKRDSFLMLTISGFCTTSSTADFVIHITAFAKSRQINWSIQLRHVRVVCLTMLHSMCQNRPKKEHFFNSRFYPFVFVFQEFIIPKMFICELSTPINLCLSAFVFKMFTSICFINTFVYIFELYNCNILLF